MMFKVTFFKKNDTNKRMKFLTVNELMELQKMGNYKITKSELMM